MTTGLQPGVATNEPPLVPKSHYCSLRATSAPCNIVFISTNLLTLFLTPVPSHRTIPLSYTLYAMKTQIHTTNAYNVGLFGVQSH